MLTALYGRLLLPFHERILHGRRTFRYLEELEKSQWMSAKELADKQLDSLRRIISHAKERCPYYSREWDRLQLHADNITSLEDFSKWPLTTRETIHVHRQQMLSTAPGMKTISKATGGSSGVPLQFDLNVESHERREAATYRGYSWAGAGPGTRQFFLWGVAVGARTWRQQWKDRLYNVVHRRTVASSFSLSQHSVPTVLANLNTCRPHAIVAYTSALYFLARELQERKLVPFSPRSIIVGAEKLHPFQRELIESVFRAPVFETYGSREVMLMGAECDRHKGLHLTAENLLIEVTDDEGRPTPKGQEGNVVVTDLTNYGMPFIRYVNGDRAIAGYRACDCGRGLPMISQVAGRQADMLRTPSGRVLTGLFFPHFLKDFPAVERFLVTQEALDAVRVDLVIRKDRGQFDRTAVTTGIANYLGPDVRLEVTEVAEIPLSAAGKQRVVVSKIAATPHSAIQA
jgi:phenylacetate-CoA ligase